MIIENCWDISEEQGENIHQDSGLKKSHIKEGGASTYWLTIVGAYDKISQTLSTLENDMKRLLKA